MMAKMVNTETSVHVVFGIVLGVVLTTSSIGLGDSARNQYVVGSSHYSAGRWKLASAEFRRFVDQFPRHPKTSNATFYLGESLVQLRRFHDAADAFEQVVVRHPSDPRSDRALFRWGESLMLVGDDVSAARLLERFRDRHPEHPLNEFALYYLGNLAAKRGDSRAIEYYSELLRAFPGSAHAAEARLQLGIQYYRNGGLSDAMHQFGLVETDYPLADSPHSTDLRTRARYWTGVTQLARKDFDNAAKTLLSVESINSNHPLVAAATYFAAESFRASERCKRANQAYTRVVRDHGDSKWADDALLGRIRVASINGQHIAVEQLAQEFGELFEKSEHLASVLELRARSLIARTEYQKAEEHLMHGIQLCGRGVPSGQTPTSDSHEQLNSLRFMASLCCLGQDKWSDALRHLDQISLNSADSLAARAALVRGCAKLELGRHSEATDDLQTALSELVDESIRDRCRAKLVRAHLAQERHADAENVYRSIENGDVDCRFESARRIADQLSNDREYNRAVIFYQELLQSDQPDHRGAGYQGLAWCHYRLGDDRQAAAAFRTFIKDFPNHELVSQSTLMLARCLESSGDSKRAAIAVLHQANWHGSDDVAVEAWLTQARLLDTCGRTHAAIIALEEACHDNTICQDDLDRVLYRLGWLYQTSNQQIAAKRAFQMLHQEHPQSPLWADATYRLAKIQTELNEIDEAAVVLERLFRSSQDCNIYPHALLLQANVSSKTGAWQETLSLVKQLVDEYCHLEIGREAEYWQAEASFRVGELDVARQRFRSLSFLPETAVKPQWQAIVPLRLAQLSAWNENWTEAARQARIVLDRYPTFSQSFEADYLLGRCLAIEAKFSKAREHYARVLDSENAAKTETPAMAQWMIGETYFHQKNYEKAICAYLRVDILYQNRHWQAAALLQAAKCFELINEVEDAANIYSRLIAEFPDTAFASQAIDRRKAMAHDGSKTAATTDNHVDLK